MNESENPFADPSETLTNHPPSKSRFTTFVIPESTGDTNISPLGN